MSDRPVRSLLLFHLMTILLYDGLIEGKKTVVLNDVRLAFFPGETRENLYSAINTLIRLGFVSSHRSGTRMIITLLDIPGLYSVWEEIDNQAILSLASQVRIAGHTEYVLNAPAAGGRRLSNSHEGTA